MLAVVAMSVGFSLTSHGAEPIGQLPAPPALSPDATEALLSIEGVPNPTHLETLIPGQTLPNLLAIAAYPGPDTGDVAKNEAQARNLVPIRLRAIRAASMFDLVGSDPLIQTRRATFQALLTANSSRASGHGVLLARAALESLGKVGGAQDPTLVTAITASLGHPSRDVRIAAARALREMGAATAVDALRRQQAREFSPGVRLVIEAAIQALNQAPEPAPSTQGTAAIQ
jgi:HEAT repeat protein